MVPKLGQKSRELSKVWNPSMAQAGEKDGTSFDLAPSASQLPGPGLA